MAPTVSETNGGVATAVWAPAAPTLTVETDLPDTDEYEVRVYDVEEGRRLVAAVEIVSPANKDRPEHRRAFVAKCAALLQNRVSVAVVDLVTARGANLYRDLLDMLGRPETPPAASVAVVRRRMSLPRTRRPPLGVRNLGPDPRNRTTACRPLPLWLADDLAVPLELEDTYEATCRALSRSVNRVRVRRGGS